jgi:hypothetical protein
LNGKHCPFPSTGIPAIDCVEASKHSKRILKISEDFFKVLSENPLTKSLCNYDDVHERKFYKLLKGPKDCGKLAVLNNCMLLYVRTLIFYKSDGTTLCQPSGVMVILRTLFGEFMRHSILYSSTRDFNHTGGFSRWLNGIWQKEQKIDPTFGDRPTKTKMPDGYVEIIRDAVLKGGALDISGDCLEDLQFLWAFVCGIQFGFRGVVVRRSDIFG